MFIEKFAPNWKVFPNFSKILGKVKIGKTFGKNGPVPVLLLLSPTNRDETMLENNENRPNTSSPVGDI
jgi:hypothetical protein